VTKSRQVVYLEDDQTAFLNVDVVVDSKSPLDALAAALSKRVSLHFVGEVRRGNFQLRFSLYDPTNIDSAVRKLVKLVESLPRSQRRLWRDARKREFDLGYQGGLKPHCSEFELSEESVAAIARLRGTIRTTIYVAPALESVAIQGRRTRTRRV
jgi:hypothetical protein